MYSLEELKARLKEEQEKYRAAELQKWYADKTLRPTSEEGRAYLANMDYAATFPVQEQYNNAIIDMARAQQQIDYYQKAIEEIESAPEPERVHPAAVEILKRKEAANKKYKRKLERIESETIRYI